MVFEQYFFSRESIDYLTPGIFSLVDSFIKKTCSSEGEDGGQPRVRVKECNTITLINNSLIKENI